jgi:hypothetical protein
MNQHRHVAIEFKCLACSHIYSMIFDAITLEKRARCGYYTKPCRVINTVDTERSHGFVDAVSYLFISLLFAAFRRTEKCATVWTIATIQEAITASPGLTIFIRKYANSLIHFTSSVIYVRWVRIKFCWVKLFGFEVLSTMNKEWSNHNALIE